HGGDPMPCAGEAEPPERPRCFPNYTRSGGSRQETVSLTRWESAADPPPVRLTDQGAAPRIRPTREGFMTNKSVISGDLSSIALADLFTLLTLAKKKGTLRCTRGSSARTLHW